MNKKKREVCEVNPQTRRCKDQWFDIHCYKEFGANSICEKKKGGGTSKQKESVLQEKKNTNTKANIWNSNLSLKNHPETDWKEREWG